MSLNQSLVHYFVLTIAKQEEEDDPPGPHLHWAGRSEKNFKKSFCEVASAHKL